MSTAPDRGGRRPRTKAKTARRNRRAPRSGAFVFTLLRERFAICRLPARARVPRWPRGAFVSITRTGRELSIVCAERAVPAGVRCVTGRRALGIGGTVDFATIGVIAGLTVPLARAGVSVFVVSTHDTDWILVRDEDLATAVATLTAAGHTVAPMGLRRS